MKEYPHIDSVYKRDLKGKFMMGEYSTPEFKYLEDKPWVWTEKIDGTNIRIMYNGAEAAKEQGDGFISFGGKTDNAQIPTKLLTRLQTYLPGTGRFAEIFGSADVCLYGEGYGAGIQKGGGLYSAEQKFILFDVKIGNWWLLRKDVEDIANKLGLDVVPMAFGGAELSLQRAIIAIQTGGFISQIAKEQLWAEGIVGQPAIPLFNRKGERIITKVKYKDFLVK